MMSPTGHTGNINSPSTPSSASPLSYSKLSAIDQASIVSPIMTKRDMLSSREPPTINQANIASPSTIKQDVLSTREPTPIDQVNIASSSTVKQEVVSSHEPPTIDQALCQTTFSTFGVTNRPSVADDDHNSHDYENSGDYFLQQHRTVEQSDSLNKDGLEDSHSSFSTFSVPANQFL